MNARDLVFFAICIRRSETGYTESFPDRGEHAAAARLVKAGFLIFNDPCHTFKGYRPTQLGFEMAKSLIELLQS